MIGTKKIIALIPARSGSKGLPGKNIKSLGGKPLIAWTIQNAMGIGIFDEIVVTTDSAEIASIARQYGATTPFLRPHELATDEASSFDVVKHALNYFEESDGKLFDLIALLEPTSPLRKKDDLACMLKQMEENWHLADSIVSVGEIQEHPSIVKKLSQNMISPFCPELEQTKRRQDNLPAYFPYGVGYIAKTDVYLSGGTFYTERCLGYLISRFQCYEIDDKFDFDCVESMLKYLLD